MADRGDLLKRVNDLGTAASRNPLSGAGSFKYGGRWNAPDSVSTIYLAVPEETCIAEFMRMAQGQGRGVDSFLPRSIHEIEVRELVVLDLNAPGRLKAVGLTAAALAHDDWSPCQEVGRLASYIGLQGIVAPSAAGVGLVVAVFEPTLSSGQLDLVSTKQMRLPS